MKKMYILIISIILIMLVALPLFLDFLIFENNYATKVSNDGWASFLGSYIGGTIGGVGTLIAMCVSVRQTKRQIGEADIKDRRKERITEAEKIAELIANYIAAINIYCDKNQIVLGEIEQLSIMLEYYTKLLRIWKETYSDRYFHNYRDYTDKLRKESINSEYAEKFFEKNISISLTEKQEKDVYHKYEQLLNNNINDYSEKKNMRYDLLEDYKQKNILGNNEYLLLDIKLKNMPNGAKLWELINNVYNQVNEYNLNYIKIKEDIKCIKDYTRDFVAEYITD